MKFKLSLLTIMFFMAVIVNVSAQLPLVYDVQNTGADFAPPVLPEPGDLPTVLTLPDPFAWSDGSGRSTDFADWEKRRNEIKAEVEHYELGTIPPRPDDITAEMDADTLIVNVTLNGETLTLTSTVTVPEGDGPFPIVVGMNNGTGSLPSELFEGVIQIGFRPNQVVANTNNYNADDPYYRLYPELANDVIGHYSAWSWGFSRLLDGIEIVQNDIKADMAHIAATGCSWQGKMALFSGAFDERVALTIAQESGGGGVNSWRVSQDIVDRGGEDVEKINNTNYSWFMDDLRNNFEGARVSSLPYDHHEIMAMIAPRALLVLGNPPFVWLADESGYVSSKATEEVYNIFGIPDRFGYSFRSGHNHCALPDASYPEVQSFVDKFLFGDTTANTDIHYQDDLDNVDYNRWIDPWKTPADPNAPQVRIDSPANNSSYDEPAEIVFEISVIDSNDNVSKVEYFNGDELLAEVTEAPYGFTWSNVLAGSYFISVVATDAEGLIGNSNIVNVRVVAPTASAYKIKDGPSIDGSIDAIWDNAKIDQFIPRQVVQGAIDDDADLSGYAKLIWDDENAYVLAVVKDESKINDSGPIYQDDNVEFYFDFDNSKGASYDGVNDVQLSFGWDDAGVIGTIGGIGTDGIEYVIIGTDDGYIMEGKIPWATSIGGTPTDGLEIGFDFMINDDDDGGDRDGKLSWNDTGDNAWQNASLFGTVKLVGSEVLTGLTDLTESSFSIYPNPAQNVILVEGIDGPFNYQILDINGKLQLKGRTQNNIQIDNLPSGVYLLNVIEGANKSNYKFVKH